MAGGSNGAATVSASDAIHDFLRALESEGMKPVDSIAGRLASGQLIRFRCEGDGPGRLNGWAILYLDERPAGAFGNYRLGIDRKWKLSEEYEPLSREEREALQREWAAAKEKKLEERRLSEQQAAIEAAEIWSSAPKISHLHPYLAKKQLDPEPLRQQGDKLLIPMYDGAGKLWNLQRVAPDGSKRFLKGGRTDGLFCIIGAFTKRGETACIGEGYATCHAIHRASGYPCVVAFSAKNMLAVARLWNDARPDLNFIICADDDSHLERNIGLEAAKAAAEAIGAKLAKPIGQAA
jgi:putative DNA primase/helicase